MMNLKKLCPPLILTLLLATSTFAGGMETGVPSPPTSPAVATTQDSNIETSSISSTTGDGTSAADVSVTEAALGLVGTVLALF